MILRELKEKIDEIETQPINVSHVSCDGLYIQIAVDGFSNIKSADETVDYISGRIAVRIINNPPSFVVDMDRTVESVIGKVYEDIKAFMSNNMEQKNVKQTKLYRGISKIMDKSIRRRCSEESLVNSLLDVHANMHKLPKEYTLYKLKLIADGSK